MKPVPRPPVPRPTAIEAEAVALERKTIAARAELAAVLADLAQAQQQLGGHQMQQLLEANEQLVLEAVRSRGLADSAAQLVTELTRTSELDALTGLPNRLLLIDRFSQALTHAKRHDGRLAMLFLDLDGFKQVNDTRGHKVGDEVLRAVSQCLVACVREADTVCRLGGDEFALLLTEISTAVDPGLVAEKLLSSLEQLTEIGGVPVSVSASIGISVFPDDAQDIERLVECADQAMYRSKRSGGHCFRFYGTDGSQSDDLAEDPERPVPSPAQTRQSRLQEANEELVLASIAAATAVEQRDRLLHELDEAARNKDEFLGVLGHELRNPLAPLLTTLDVMRLRSGGHESAEHSTMRRHLGHLVRLVDDLQDIAKVATGKIDLRVELIAISDVAAEAIAMARPLLEQRLQRFEFHEEPRLACWGDSVRLAQCVANLLINAARYTPPGGGVTLTTRREEEQIVIAVRDDGRGISERALPNVFNLFFQERVDAQSHDGGLGVGLALVRSLVALHAGTVTAHSEGLGLGSEFVIRLPGVDAGDDARLAQAPQLAATTHGRRILIVDDNYDAADSLGLLLRMYGHQVWVATHPVAALQMVATVAPDLALLDIGLPGMDGYELAHRIRTQHPELKMAMVALSGYGRAVDRARSEHSRFDAHLVKPVDMGELEQVLLSVHGHVES